MTHRQSQTACSRAAHRTAHRMVSGICGSISDFGLDHVQPSGAPVASLLADLRRSPTLRWSGDCRWTCPLQRTCRRTGMRPRRLRQPVPRPLAWARWATQMDWRRSDWTRLRRLRARARRDAARSRAPARPALRMTSSALPRLHRRELDQRVIFEELEQLVGQRQSEMVADPGMPKVASPCWVTHVCLRVGRQPYSGCRRSDNARSSHSAQFRRRRPRKPRRRWSKSHACGRAGHSTGISPFRPLLRRVGVVTAIRARNRPGSGSQPIKASSSYFGAVVLHLSASAV